LRILNSDALTCHGNIAGRKDLLQILEAGLQASDPYYNTRKIVRREANKLIVGRPDYEPTGAPWSGEAIFDLDSVGRVFVFGAGKGMHRIAEALEEVLGDRLEGGHLVLKYGDQPNLKRIGVTFGAHPAPDEGCARGCQIILDMCQGMTENDLVFTIAGNGVGSLMSLPAEGLTAEDLAATTYVTQIERGVPTVDLSPVRNHIDRIKGGKMARALQPATAIHLLGIDANINSFKGKNGYDKLVYHNFWLHTLPDYTTYQDAINALNKWNAWDAVPERVRQHLLRADPAQETVKGEEYERGRFRIYGVMPIKLGPIPVGKAKAEELGYKAYTFCQPMRAEAREAARVMAGVARTIELLGEPLAPPCALFTSGELLVTVGKETGIGGRNQEYALAAAVEIAGSDNILFGAIDTDGTDGPGAQFAPEDPGIPTLTGGMVDGQTAAEAKAAGVDIWAELGHHNTTPALWQVGSGIWATQNISVGDMGVVLIRGRTEPSLSNWG
jgi:glycerate 2-kinase